MRFLTLLVAAGPFAGVLAGCGRGTAPAEGAGMSGSAAASSEDSSDSDRDANEQADANDAESADSPADEAAQVEIPAGDVERPEYVDSSGFFVLNGRLYDKYENDFVIRGINNAHRWFYADAYNALDHIADLGFNSVRIVWETDATASELEAVLVRVIGLDMIPMVELHDATGARDNESLLAMAEYYARDDVKRVLDRYQDYVLLNIANEWSGRDFFGGYSAAVELLRAAEVQHTLVIDANGWGQNADSVLEFGADLLADDPQHNLLFSVHMYEAFAESQRVIDVFDTAIAIELPLIVGEFGHQHGDPPVAVSYETILSEAAGHGLGYVGWSWKGNSGNVAYLDIGVDWNDTELTDWGEMLVESPNGIADTAMKASVFLF